MKVCCVFLLCILFTLCSAGEKSAPPDTSSDSSAVTQPASDGPENPSDPQYPDGLKWYTMFQRIPGDWVTYADRTFREENIPGIAAMAGLTAFAIWTDQPVWEASDRWYKSSHTIRKASDFFVYLGDGTPQFGLAAAFGAYGLLARDNRAMRTGSQIVETVPV